MAACRGYSGIFNTIKWQPSNKLLCRFHIQSQAAKDSLHFKSRIFTNTELKSTRLYPSPLQLKQHVTFSPRCTKLPQLHTFTTCSRQFIHCFCTESSSNNLVGCCPFPQGFSPVSLVSDPPSTKTNTSKFQFDQESESTGILNSIKWQPTNKLLRCIHIQSQAAKDSLHFKSRLYTNTELKLTQFNTSSLQLKRHVSPFLPRFAKFPQLLTLKTCSRQFIHCFCTESSSNNLQNRTSDVKKDAYKSKLSHVDNQGHAQMVDVGAKKDSNRLAVAKAVVYLGPEAFRLVKENKIHKGDVLTVAQLAGIMASKLTPNLIPLCHNIHITHAEVNLELDENKFAVNITGSVNSVGRTGVEMESLTAVTVAALTVYDMCKAVSRDIVISDIKLVKKVGGKSGYYVAS